jgi:hypothetical protein
VEVEETTVIVQEGTVEGVPATAAAGKVANFVSGLHFSSQFFSPTCIKITRGLVKAPP